jgi:phage shock protein E
VTKKIFFVFILFSNLIISEVLIDVRTSDEFKLSHIENAINIQWEDILIISNDVSKDTKIYLYCRSGNRSQKATDILLNAGFDQVENLGGIQEAAEKLKLKIVN